MTTPASANQKVTRNILRAPDYGPVSATATVEGAPMALAIQRSTFFGLADPPNIHWQNHSTWQQVVQLTQKMLH